LPEVLICTENDLIPALSVVILFNGERLEYLPEYFFQHLSVCFLLLIPPLVRDAAVLDRNWEKSDRYDPVH
jgi:hypothetical protein